MQRWRQTVVVPANGDVISLAVAKQHLRVESTAEDGLISRAAAAAVDYVQNHSGRRLLTAQMDLRTTGFPIGSIELPTGPLRSLDAIAYRADEGSDETVIAAADYEVLPETDFSRALVVPPTDGWPAADGRFPYPVRLRCTVGYGTAADVPAALQQALLLLIGHWYENRQEVVVGTVSARVSLAADQLIRDYVI